MGARSDYWEKVGNTWIHVYNNENKPMLMKQVPHAIRFKLECENGKKAERMVFLNGEKPNDALYRISKQVVDASGRTGLNVWIEEYTIVYDLPLPAEEKDKKIPELPIHYMLA